MNASLKRGRSIDESILDAMGPQVWDAETTLGLFRSELNSLWAGVDIGNHEPEHGSARPRAGVGTESNQPDIRAKCFAAIEKANAEGTPIVSKNQLARAVQASASGRALRSFWKQYEKMLPGGTKPRQSSRTENLRSREVDPLKKLIADEAEANGTGEFIHE